MPNRFPIHLNRLGTFLISETSSYVTSDSNSLIRNELQETLKPLYNKSMNAKDYTATVPEYASRWKLNVQTVHRFIREGRLHAVKVGRSYFLNPDVIPAKEGHSADK